MLRSTGCAGATTQKVNYAAVGIFFHINILGTYHSGQLMNLGLYCNGCLDVRMEFITHELKILECEIKD